MLNFLKYPGNKYKYLSIIKKVIDESQSSIYIEPFLGSANILINLTQRFQQRIGADINQRVMQLHKAFSRITYQQLEYVYYELMIQKFGNIGMNKEAYYNFRNYMNTLPESDQKNIMLYYCIRSCINSLIRFGPNGFNQSYGKRCTDIYLTKDNLIKLNKSLSTTKLLTADYRQLMQDKNLQQNENILWVLDPPYYNSNPVYGENNFKEYNYQDFKNVIQKIKGDIIYFDVKNNFGDQFFKQNVIIRENMKNISPNRQQNDTFTKQMMYYNIK